MSDEVYLRSSTPYVLTNSYAFTLLKRSKLIKEAEIYYIERRTFTLARARAHKSRLIGSGQSMADFERIANSSQTSRRARETCTCVDAPSWQGLCSRLQDWSVRPHVRPFSATHEAAGHNALRGSSLSLNAIWLHAPKASPVQPDALLRWPCTDHRLPPCLASQGSSYQGVPRDCGTRRIR